MSARSQSLLSGLRCHKRRARVAACAPLLFLGLPLFAGAAAPDYTQDIKPIFQKHCHSCHGRLKQKSDLRLDAGVLIRKGGKHGPVVVSGNSQESELVKRVTSTVEDERMPPEGKPLDSAQVALLAAWIDAGAAFPADEKVPSQPAEHWAFQPVTSPPLMSVKDAAWG